MWAFQGDGDANDLVCTGSHLDSVPDGGAFDGPLGIASAFAAIDFLAAQGLHPHRPLAIVAFTEEEGGRFGVPCLGSRLLTGAIEPVHARSLTDSDGMTLGQAMAAAGFDPKRIGPDPEVVSRIGAFIELHIEQGRALEVLKSPVGIGSGIWPHGRWRIDFEGRADHAGTTRMEDRNDPMVAFAATVARVTEEAVRLGARSTFGRLHVIPNATNAIPSRVTAWLDARASNQTMLHSLLDQIDPSIRVTNESLSSRVEFDSGLRQRLTQELGQPPSMATAAGHDAGILAAAGVPTAMLFVRNPTGVSHSPLESASGEDCQEGVEALAKVLGELAEFK
jgi:N-carbamoyl-L-amino-acid hydrolase